MKRKVKNDAIKNYFREFQNGNVIFNYSCYFENDTYSKIIDFLQSLSDEISKRNFNTIKFNCVINDFEFSHQILFNFIYADYLDDAPNNLDDNTPFIDCNEDFYYDMRTYLFIRVRYSILKIWNNPFLEYFNKENICDKKNAFSNYNSEDADFIVYQNLSGDNIDGFLAQRTEY